MSCLARHSVYTEKGLMEHCELTYQELLPFHKTDIVSLFKDFISLLQAIIYNNMNN